MAEPTADSTANPPAKPFANPTKEQVAETAADPSRGAVFGIGSFLPNLILQTLGLPKLGRPKLGLPKWAVPKFLRPRSKVVPSEAAAEHAAPLPMVHGAVPSEQAAVPTGQDLIPPRQPRWTADGWALVRGGGSEPALAVGAAAYGASQAGAVLRYNLAPSSRLRPQAFVRVTTPLAGRGRESGRQGEGAFGLMVRPVRRLPLAIMGEMRMQENGGNARVRPVITAVTEIPPLRLPLKAEGEVYAQAGWAGGQGATPFYDMSAVVQRCVVEPCGIQLRAGGGLWSGGQRGAVRLDFGPRLELRGMIGGGERRLGVRLSADWRFRIAGQAEPGSGPAITLAAGF